MPKRVSEWDFSLYCLHGEFSAQGSVVIIGVPGSVCFRRDYKRLSEKFSDVVGYKARAAQGRRVWGIRNEPEQHSNAVDASLETFQAVSKMEKHKETFATTSGGMYGQKNGN